GALLHDLLPKEAEISVLPDDSPASWDTINQADLFAGNTSVRLHLPVATLAVILNHLLQPFDESFAAADFGTGIIRFNFAADEAQSIALIKQMRAEAAAVGGNLFIERAAPEIKNQLGAWNEVSDLAKLMRGVKRNFDPESLLNPGRFVAGI
ncbi:MAG: FAD-linked oxidase C-terminal domain-containing protein, partial [Burkholderiales bacterium]